MEAIILTEGGTIGGLGHIARCSSVSEALAEKGIQSKFIINGDDSIKKALNGASYQLCNWLEEKDEIFPAIKKADIVIIDSYLADIDFYRELSEAVKVPVYIDDNKRLDYPRGFVVNSGIEAGTLGYSNEKDNKYLLGSRYALLRNLFWEDRKSEIRDTIESIMVTTGGYDLKNVVPSIVKFLNLNYPSLQKNIIIGNAFDNIDEIKAELAQNTNLVYFPDAKKMTEIMLQSDIAISSGGQTLYELARLGIPTIAFCQAENQKLNLEGWKKEGFIEYVGGYDDFETKIAKSLEKLSTKEERVRRSCIGKKLVDGQGARRIAEILLNNEHVT